MDDDYVSSWDSLDMLRPYLLAFALCTACAMLSQTAPGPKPPAPAAQSDLLDINTATAAQLKSLPGIGEAYAKRIIDGRPYTAKNQLVKRGILPQAVYDKVAGKMIAKHGMK